MSDLSKDNNSRKDTVIYRLNEDGTNNSTYIDLLDEDKAVAGQKFVCISFVSPEKIIEKKEIYFFDQFLKQYDLFKSLEKFSQFLNFISYKYHLDFDKLSEDMKEFTEEEKDNLYQTNLSDEYKTYLDNHEESLEDKFKKEYSFETSVRGVKIRGSYPTQEEAELRCKILRELDPNHDVFVGPVGLWMPWDPEAYKTGRVEYLEDELNQLMNEKSKNEKAAKTEFDKRIKEAKEKAMRENMKNAEDSGNSLTQVLNKEGNLVNVKDMNSTELNLLQEKDNISSQDIRKALFDSAEVVKGDTDHGLSRLNLSEDIKIGIKNGIEEENSKNDMEMVD